MALILKAMNKEISLRIKTLGKKSRHIMRKIIRRDKTTFI